MDIILNSSSKVGYSPKGLVTIKVMDAVTGKDISRLKLPVRSPNTACIQSKIAAAHVLAGDPAYAVTRIEWGIGHSGPAQLANTNLETPLYSTDPLTQGVFSAATAEFPTADGQVRFISELTSTTPGLAAFETPSVNIWEVGLRTSPLPGYPKGLLVARFVNDAPIQKSGSRVKIGIEWLYIYA